MPEKRMVQNMENNWLIFKKIRKRKN